MSQKNSIYVSRSVRTIAVMTLVTSLVWTAIGIYSALTKPAEVEVKPELLKAIDPTLDTDTLTILSQKRQLTDDTQATELLQQMLQLAARQKESPSVNEVTLPTGTTTASVSAESAL